MKTLFTILFGFSLFCSINAQNPSLLNIDTQTDSIIKVCISSIEADSIQSYMQSLEEMEIRFAYYDNRKDVAEWIANKFRSFGYTDVQLQQFNMEVSSNIYDNYNVVCLKPGQNEKQIIIGAHHDAVENSPGADDNASGTAGVLEIARVMIKHNIPMKHTLKFITFANEENGLHGSEFSANESKFMGDSLLIMINMDMIANSSTDSANQIVLKHKTKDAALGSITQEVANTYTNMNMVYDGYPPNSDHYSYGQKGYDILYFEEFEFSTVYHSSNDKVSNTNKTYASRVIKTVLATVMAFDNNTLYKLEYYNLGDGKSAQLMWNRNNNDSKYQVFQSSDSASFIVLDSTYINEFKLTNLSLNQNYEIYIQAIDKNGNKFSSNTINFTTNNIPLKPANFTAKGLSKNILFNWQKNNEIDIKGYNIYENSNILKKINEDLIYDTTYSFLPSIIDKYIYYYVTAVDTEGNESQPSNSMGAKLGTHTYLEDSIELLVVIDIKANINTSNAAELFFNSTLKNHSFVIYNLLSKNNLSQEILNHSKKVIYCAPLLSEKNSYYKDYHVAILNYLKNGGKLLLTVSDVVYATSQYNRLLPSEIPLNHTSNTMLKTNLVNYDNYSWFSGSKAVHANYPDLDINYNAVPDILYANDHVEFVQSIAGANDATTIYNYQSPFPTSLSKGKMHNWPVGTEYIGNDFDLVFMSFPICYMHENQAQVFFDYVLNERFNNQTTNIDIVKESSARIHVWPNPANGSINVELPQNGTIEIFNTLGQMVYSEQHLLKGIFQIRTEKWTNGYYFIKLRTNGALRTTKIIIQH